MAISAEEQKKLDAALLSEVFTEMELAQFKLDVKEEEDQATDAEDATAAAEFLEKTKALKRKLGAVVARQQADITREKELMSQFMAEGQKMHYMLVVGKWFGCGAVERCGRGVAEANREATRTFSKHSTTYTAHFTYSQDSSRETDQGEATGRLAAQKAGPRNRRGETSDKEESLEAEDQAPALREPK